MRLKLKSSRHLMFVSRPLVVLISVSALCTALLQARQGGLKGQAPNVAPDTAYARIAAGVSKTDSLIKTGPRPSFKNVESMIVVEDAVVKFEGYYNGADRNAPHELQSQTKSVVAILLGIAIDKGYVSNEGEPLSKYFPEQFGPETGLKATVTIRDLLTMSAGFEWEEWIPVEAPGNDNTKMFLGGKWLEYALGRRMAQRPNTVFKYNSGCPMIVGAVIEKATKMRLEQFAAKFLFGPLGITGYRWLKDATGLYHAGGGLDLKPYDMVKVGIVVMNNGRWKNTRIVSEAWIKKATTPYFKTPLDDSRFGYYWWIRDMHLPTGKTTRVISAGGWGGQNLYILPEYRLIVAFTERNYSTPQVGPMVLRESVLPALR